MTKPNRVQLRRHSQDSILAAKIQAVASTIGNAPGLDALLLRLHIETATRRGVRCGCGDLGREQCLALLRENGTTSRFASAASRNVDPLIGVVG